MTIKTFAQEARQLLIDGVAKKLLYWGFDTKGQVLEQPDAVSGGYLFRGEAYDDTNVPGLWKSLRIAVQQKGIEVVVEEAAYTWFNRMMAIRILAKNGYDLPQLDYAEGLNNTPIILQKARQGQYAFLNDTEKTRLQGIIGDYNKEKEAFALLLVGYCHSHTTLNKVFGKLDDYTELLLPDNMLQDQGFLNLLNTTDAISDEEYKEVELIGWLYQFYISELKDEVFASFKKKKKAEAKDIPAATQIFTPNWIVKYMVENTAGKIWLDHKPNSPLKDQMKYLVTNENAVSSSAQHIENKALITDIEQLTLIDPACGSGHILVEGFQLLYQMYMEEYYTPEEAVQTIFKKNLYGLDIDDRAAQLASFALMLKAAKVYPDVWERDWKLNIYAMPEANSFSRQEVADFLGEEGSEFIDELEKTLELMQQAKNLGSIMQFDLSAKAIEFITLRYEELQKDSFLDFNVQTIVQKGRSFIPVLLLLVKKYSSVVANPPYMKHGNMNGLLKNYVNKMYPLSKSDLFSVFMECTLSMTLKEGLMGMINQHSWMFLSSYIKIRKYILKNCGIVNMLHLGPRTFEELSGEVVQSTAFVLIKGKTINSGTYYRLVDYKSVLEKEHNFLKKNNRYSDISQANFNRIPGNPISYWASSRNLLQLEEYTKLGVVEDCKKGADTGNNSIFLRYWSEVSKLKVDYHKKWIFYNKGGSYRRWYGNFNYVVNYENNGEELKNSTANLRSKHLYFKDSLTWNALSSGLFSIRYSDKKTIFDSAGSSLFLNKNENTKYYYLGLLNSTVIQEYLLILNPTFNYGAGTVAKLPLKSSKNVINDMLVKQNINISRKDWNSRETSWDFQQSSLLSESSSLNKAYQVWQEDVTKDFFQLHSNEEEINRIFIEIYGLQKELTPVVPLKNITILQEELKSKDLEALEEEFRVKGSQAINLPLNKAEVMSQFISYAIGLFMGRYRLDKPGLNIAHPNPSEEELTSYNYNDGKVTIDEDAIIPLMGRTANFKDDALYQIQELLDTIWGTENRTANLNFLQDGLNKDLEKFIVEDFWMYHCSMYKSGNDKKKPIYWLFSSKKGAFQVLVYMHRMNAFTVEKVREKYLLAHLKHLTSQIVLLEKDQANLTAEDARNLDQLRKDQSECEEYDLILKNTADQQITIDLDNGVTENYKLFEAVLAKIK